MSRIVKNSSVLLVLISIIMLSVSCPNPTVDFGDQTGPAVWSISISPRTMDVEKGEDEQFSVEVKTIGSIDNSVLWELEGNVHASTTVTPGGLLQIHGDETATRLTVKAVSVANSSMWAKAYITVSEAGSIPRYDVEVIDGISDKTIYKAGQKVSIEADPPADKYFIEWTAESPGVVFLNEQSVRTSFVMPKNPVSISAICEYIPTVTSVSIKPEKTTVQIGTTKKFKATVDGLGNFDDSVIWELEVACTVNSGHTITLSFSDLHTIVQRI